MLDSYPDQLTFPFPIDTNALEAFVAEYLAIEEEQERLRETLAALKKKHEGLLPLRGILAALKIERTTRTVESHATESMPRMHITLLQVWVQQYLEQRAREVQALLDEATGEVL